MQILVSDVLSQPPVVVMGTSLYEALRVLLDYGASEVYVTDRDGGLLGAITDYDLLKTQLGPFLRDEPVENLVSRSIPTVGPDTPVEEVAPLFREARHQAIAVVDSGRIVGQIGRRDVMQLLLSLEATTSNETDHSTSQAALECTPPVLRPQFARPRRSDETGTLRPRLSLFAGTPQSDQEPV